MLTYVGEGYSRAFTANYDRIVARLSAGEEIELVAGPDDVCAPLLEGAEPHCHQESVVERDRLAALAVSEIVGRRLAVRETIELSAALVERMREAFARGISREACSACEWSGLCTRIAGGGYTGVRLEC
nr:DUF1284 domain-containing protein [Paradevosia shaoguanensis]